MKSIATETIMKIFIMIAVILIASSFLLKAFNIDIFGFLKEKLGEFGIKGGKALHVVIDEHASEIWNVHLTDGESSKGHKDIFEDIDVTVHPTNDNSVKEGFYILKNAPSNKCLIFATDEQSGEGVPDEGYIYYVKEGAVIQDGCTDIKTCIGSFLDTSAPFYQGCKNVWKEGWLQGGVVKWSGKCTYVGFCIPGACPYKNDLKDSKYCGKDCFEDSSLYFTPKTVEDCPTPNLVAPICDKEEVVGNLAFKSTPVYNWAGSCADSKDSNKLPHPNCNLLVQKDKTFQFKYGLVCHGGKWHPCTEEAKKNKETYAGKTCDGALGIWTWK